MKSRHAAVHALRIPSPYYKASKSYTQQRTSLPPSPPESYLTGARLPFRLLDDPEVSVIQVPFKKSLPRARFFLFTPPKPRKPSSAASFDFSLRMLNWLQIVTTPTADTLGTSLILHFDNKRYLFGNVAEGSQRAVAQRKVSLSKVQDIFMTGTVNWQNSGGILGMILTIADMQITAHESAQKSNDAPKKKSSKANPVDTAPPQLDIHGGKNLSHLLATSRRFIFRKGLPLRPHEIRHNPRASEQTTAEPDWKDGNINVWYMPVESNAGALTSPRKRSHEEFIESGTASNEAENLKLVEAVVAKMFNSGWRMDALVETTLHQAQLPAKLFVRDDQGHIQVYTGPTPDKTPQVPDIPVLVRQPWPGALVETLPRTRPSTQSMCYIVKTHDRRGKFNAKAAENLGVVKSDNKVLARGENAVAKDGTVITPEMVMGETVPGTGFAVVDLPDISYVGPLINRAEWSDDHLMKGILVIIWTLGRDVVNDPRLQDFMKNMSSVRHIVSSADTCPNMLSLESIAAQTYKLRCIDPERFPFPVYSNELSLSGAPTSSSSPIYEVGRTGKTVQFAPHFLHQDDKIIPFPDIEKLARDDLTAEVRQLAEQARSKIVDPDFLAKVERAEADIPHRDAEVITLGTGSSLPSKYRNVSATLVRVPGYGNYLFDAGENTLGQLRRVFGSELPEVLRDLKAIWISHLHADHHLGTVSVIKAWHQETRESRPAAQLLVASHIHMVDWLREYADVEDYGYDRLVTTTFKSSSGSLICDSRLMTSTETQAFGLKKIDACFVSHCFGALATVFTFPGGLKVAYSGDCRPSDGFVKIGRGATLLIHESTFDDALQGDAIAKKHSTMSEAIDVGRRMGARRILLTHFSQRYQKVPLFEESFEVRPDDIQPDADAWNKAKADEVILVAFDYMRVKLGDFRKAQAFLPALQKLFEEAEE